MASEVDICNLALSHLGDVANVSSLDPPEGSAQAEHCSRFYPMARDAILEMHNWSFATRRVLLASLTPEWDSWEYAYSRPSQALKIISVYDSTVTDDDVTTIGRAGQQYVCEIDSNGDQVILTNVEDAACRYIVRVTDTTRFSPLFIMATSWYLASMLAGPILKGDVGAQESKRCLQLAMQYVEKAAASDANQQRKDITHSPSWISARS